MSNLETQPREEVCTAGPGAVPSATPGSGEIPGRVEIIEHREVPLGGTRSMTVRRTLPQRARSLVGAWCFADHYGPDDVSRSAGMQVGPHPHTGLQTVSWLFEGEILHRDSIGSLQTVRPGELNLMTAGRGISHAEESPDGPRPPRLHGVQLWVALPQAQLDAPPAFEHHADLPDRTLDGVRVRVIIGELGVGGEQLRSAATAYTPLVGAQLDLDPGTTITLDVAESFEHAILVDAGDVTLDGETVPVASLGYLPTGSRTLTVAAPSGPARVVLLGGEPFAEEIVMWWNFVGRSHDDVVAARAEWQAQLEVTSEASPLDGGTRYAPDARGARFGVVDGYDGGPLPAPVLPDVRLKPRSRPTSGA